MKRRKARPEPLPLQTGFELFAAELARSGRSPRTAEWYHTNLRRRWGAFVAARGLPDDMRQIRRDHVRDFATYVCDEVWAKDRDGQRSPRRLSPTTRRGMVVAVRAFFRWLRRERLIESEIVEDIHVPSVNHEPKAAYSDDEIARLLAPPATETPLRLRNRALVGFIAETGCRASEARTAQLADLDLAQRRVTVTGKGSRTRVLPVSDGLAALLTEYLERARPKLEREPSPWLFLSNKGQPITLFALEQFFRRMCVSAGVPSKGRGTHGLRRSFTVRWIRRGGDPYTLRLLLGHHGLNVIAAHYAALLPKDVDDRFRSLGVGILPGALADPGPSSRTSDRRPRRRARRRRLVRR